MTIALTVVATLVALAALRLLLRRAHRRGWSRHRGVPFRWLARRIGARPEQERILQEESDALAAELGSLRDDGRALRAELAALVEGPSLDPALLDAALRARLARLDAVRERAAAALGRLHASLDDGQRRALAELLRSGPARSRACGHA